MDTLPDRWLAQIASASTNDEIVALARDFAGQLTESERMRLPPKCLPPSFKSAPEVNDYALTLTRAQLAFRGALSSEIVLERLMLFYSKLAGRIALIERAARPRDPTPDVITRTRS
jgi:hypothetical protein